MRGGGGDVPSIISVLLSKDSTKWGNVRVNGRKHRMEEKLVNPVFYDKLEEEISGYELAEISVDKWWAPFSW
jgi:hypothetical protein